MKRTHGRSRSKSGHRTPQKDRREPERSGKRISSSEVTVYKRAVSEKRGNSSSEDNVIIEDPVVELLDTFRMKQTKMYVCTLEEFILVDLDTVLYM